MSFGDVNIRIGARISNSYDLIIFIIHKLKDKSFGICYSGAALRAYLIDKIMCSANFIDNNACKYVFVCVEIFITYGTMIMSESAVFGTGCRDFRNPFSKIVPSFNSATRRKGKNAYKSNKCEKQESDFLFHKSLH